MEAQIIPGGIKIAGISQNDLEYDPVLYQRDRGELDWDARSIASTNILDGPSPGFAHVRNHGSTSSLSKFGGYDRYLAEGPHGPGEIEMLKMDSMQEPLLSPRSMGFAASQQSLISPVPPSLNYEYDPNNIRQAPVYRPQGQAYPSYSPDGAPAYTSRTHSPAPQYYPPYAQQHHSRDSTSSNNMAGRGAYRG